MKVSGTVYVLLGPDQSGLGRTNPDQSETSPDESATGPLLEAKEETIAGLRDQVSYLREQLGQEREANRENRRIIAGLVQRIPELEAAPETRDGHETASENPEDPSPRPATAGAQEGAQEPKETARRPWWVRWFGG